MAPFQAMVQPMAIKPKTKNNDLLNEVEITQSRMAYKSIHDIMPQNLKKPKSVIISPKEKSKLLQHKTPTNN